MEKQLKDYGLSDQAHRFAAINGDHLERPAEELPTEVKAPPGDLQGRPWDQHSQAFACTCSMASCIAIAQMYEEPYFLYLEDDAMLFPKLNEYVELNIKRLPNDWDIFSPGSFCATGHMPVNKYISRPNSNHLWGAHFIIFRETAYNKVLRHVGTGPLFGSDVLLGGIPDLNIYLQRNMFFRQHSGFSDTTKTYRDSTEEGDRWNENGQIAGELIIRYDEDANDNTQGA
jgi:GR25 family glycosyltransferase involved in LPS biosynthesis